MCFKFLSDSVFVMILYFVLAHLAIKQAKNIYSRIRDGVCVSVVWSTLK